MVISFNDIGQVCASFAFDGTLQVGDPCKISRSATVIKGSEGDAFIGKALAIRDNMASVAVKGCMSFPYTGTMPSAGFAKLTCDGNGGVCINEDGREYLIISVDIINHIVTVML